MLRLLQPKSLAIEMSVPGIFMTKDIGGTTSFRTSFLKSHSFCLAGIFGAQLFFFRNTPQNTISEQS
jgi:hypothetical protein